jgi:hypothetical protein
MAVPKYFSSEWSYAQIRGVESRSICAFGSEPNTIVVVSAEGSFLLSKFQEGGECERMSYAKFIKGPSDEELDNMEVPLGVPATAPTPTTVIRGSINPEVPSKNDYVAQKTSIDDPDESVSNEKSTPSIEKNDLSGLMT